MAYTRLRKARLSNTQLSKTRLPHTRLLLETRLAYTRLRKARLTITGSISSSPHSHGHIIVHLLLRKSPSYIHVLRCELGSFCSYCLGSCRLCCHS
ncbi:MAG: hypothetical protein ACOH2E_06480 [Candidatus Paracaedibacter sp.]